MPINWDLAKTPLSNTAPEGGGMMAAKGVLQGAAAGVAPQMAQAGLQQAQAQGVLAQSEAAHAPAMAELKQAMASGAIKAQDLQNAQQTYSLAQSILGPSAIAAQQGDMKAAASIYENGLKQLQGAGIDTKSLGAPDQFDPAYVKSAYQNVTQQMAMAKQMLDMAGLQSNIDRNISTVGINNAREQQIAYETGIPVTGSQAGGFSFPGQGGVRSSSGLTPKAQSAVNQKQAEAAIAAREVLATQAGKARTQEGLLNEAKDILERNPNITGKIGMASKFISPDVERLEKIYNDVTLGKLQTDYAGQGMGALDVAVFNTIKSTMPTVGDYAKNQKTAVDNALMGVKSKQLANDVAVKLNNAGVYDENLRAQIGNQIAAGLDVKSGQSMNLENFNKAPSVISKVLKQYGIEDKNPDEAPKIAALSPEQLTMRDKAISGGANPTAVDAYFAKLNEKQR